MKRTLAIVTSLSAAPLHLRLLGGFALVLAVSAGQTVFAYRTAIENSAADESVARGEQILGLIAKTRADLLQMEAGYSRFSMATRHSMTGRHTFLDSYAAGARAYGMDLRALEDLTAGDAGEQARWHDLEWRAAAWQRDVIEPTIAGKLDVSSSASQTELQLGDMERILGEATAVELAHQSEEHQWTVFTDDRMRGLLLWGTVAVVGVGLVVALLFARALARALAQVRAGERRYRQMFVNNPAIKLLIDPSSGAIVEANEAACDFYGYLRADLVRRRIWDITILPKELTLANLANALRDVRTSVVSRHRLASGEVRDVEVQASPVEAEAHGKVLVYAIVHDITERKHAEDALRHQALHDELTGLPNRTLLQDRLAQAILAARRGTTPLTLLLVDLDRFKEINDTFGHHYGDLLLQQIGPRLRGVLRESDTVARLGGDEFGIVLPTTDAASAVSVSQQLLRILEAPFDLDGQSVEIGASIGVASYPAHGRDAATLLRGADVAMYVAKRGESGVVVYAAEQDHYSAERLALGGELRRALENGELLLHFQPKLDMRDGSLVGVEALVRWQHPLRGFLPPSEFIPLAEQTGLIYPLTHWVLEAALRQHQAWRAQSLDIPVAVNLSRRTLHDPRLPEMVAQLLARYAVPPSALVLEITESSLMADPLHAGENLAQLRALGVKMSIDDFGTGYSSLDSLKDLSVDELKIDRSFVQAMATDASARAIVRAIIDLADALKLRAVAEGVEDRATWEVLAGLGCDVAQGYFLCRPIGAAELEVWIAEVSQSWLDSAERSRVQDALQERIRGRGARLIAEEEFIARKKAEAALLVSEQRNRLALEAAGMGTWDWDVINDIHTWSTEAEALSGLAPGSYDGTFEAFRRAVHPDDWPALEIEERASQAEHRDSITTFRTVWPDGTVRWIESKGRALHDADGALVRVIGTSLDITERKLAEEALRASEERFRRQYKGLPLPTYSWLHVGDDFVLQDCNDAAEASTEGNLADWLGSRASERFADQPEILADLHACLTEQRTIRRETQHRYHNTGRVRQLVFSYVFVPPQTVMVHREDITEAKQADQQRGAIAQSDKLVTQVTPEHAGPPLDLTRLARDAA